MLVSYNWLKEYVDIDLEPQELADEITMGGVEVEEVRKQDGDYILNLAPTPNRGDCLNIVGVAREVAALLGKEVKLPDLKPVKGEGALGCLVEVIVKDHDACPRYTARVIKGVKVKPSPEWLVKRLEAVGLRSINNVVDATNYVLMELGQPVHAFDLRLLEGGKLIIDRAKKDCTLKTLDAQEYTFKKGDILNLDAKRAIGAAGIMGGENSGVLPDTRTLVLESAYFEPVSIRKTSRRTGLFSESSRRFEKGVDPNGVINGMHRMTALIVELAGGVPSKDWIDIYPAPFKETEIALTLHEVNWLLGTAIGIDIVREKLEAIGSEIVKVDEKKITVRAPMFRPDLTRPIDLIEEVARLYGYENIKSTLPVVQVSAIVRPKGHKAEAIAKEVMLAHGFFETVNYSFASKEQQEVFGSGEAVKLDNPLTADMVYMRTSLVPALITDLKGNLNRQIKNVRLFELSTVFFKKGDKLPEEKKYIAGIVTGDATPGKWSGERNRVDLFDAKAAVFSLFDRLGLGIPNVQEVKKRGFLNPAESMDLIIGKEVIGYCGRLHPSLEREYDFQAPVYIFEVDFTAILEEYSRKSYRYSEISRYPVVERDVAFLVKSPVTHKEIMQSFNKKLNKLVQSIELFDIYSGKGIPEGQKSMAYRAVFGSREKTLSDGEVDRAFAELVDSVKSSVGAEIR